MSKAFLAGMLVASFGVLAVVSDSVKAKAKSGSEPIHTTKQADTSSSLLRGGTSNDRKGGRYLATPSPSLKKLPGKKKPPTLTLIRGKSAD